MTPAIRALQRAKVSFEIHEYDHDPSAESYGLEAADKLGVERGRVYKTLIASLDGTLAVGVLPVDHSLSLKAFASALGGKKAIMAEVKDAERATGYVTGGISPLGQKRALPTVIDASALTWERVLVSAGKRGMQVELDPQDLVRLLRAKTASIAT